MKYERLEELRDMKDWKQTYVAKCLNIGQRTYSHYENGTRSIPTETLSALADLYATSVDYLIGRTDEKKPYPKGKAAQTDRPYYITRRAALRDCPGRDSS